MIPKSGEADFDELLPRNVVVLLGAHNIDRKIETGRSSLSPSRIVVHDEWNHKTERYDSDIAMLILENEVTPSKFVNPICLWRSPSHLAAKIGTVAGWGQSADKSKYYEPVPTMLKVPIHTNEDCYLKNPLLAKLSSKRTFCAGSGNGTGVCLGDSGHGLFVRLANVFYLKGIVSSSMIDDGTCDVYNYAIYTNVNMYSRWISNLLNENNSSSKRPTTTTITPKENVCTQPEDSGKCYSYIPQFTYDASRGFCKPFFYGGCNGNGNRFETHYECELACMNRTQLGNGSISKLCRNRA